MTDAVIYQVADNVAEILLAQPPVNALTEAMVDQVLAGLRRAAADVAATALPALRPLAAGEALGTLRR